MVPTRLDFRLIKTIYATAFDAYFKTLEYLEGHLSDGRPYLTGNHFSEADLRLFPNSLSSRSRLLCANENLMVPESWITHILVAVAVPCIRVARNCRGRVSCTLPPGLFRSQLE